MTKKDKAAHAKTPPNTPLTDKLRQRILAKLSAETSDTRLSEEFEVSRKTIWRLRQQQGAMPTKQRTVLKPLPPPPTKRLTGSSLLKKLEKANGKATPVAAVTTVAAPSLKARPVDVDPRPKVDVVPTVMGSYFGVQILLRESYKDVANLIISTAQSKGSLFRKLQVLDLQTIGTMPFIRFRSDIEDPYAVLKHLPRGIIVPIHGTYTVFFTGGRTGKFPTSTMCSPAKTGYGHIYAGTRIKLWRQQFAET